MRIIYLFNYETNNKNFIGINFSFLFNILIFGPMHRKTSNAKSAYTFIKSI